MAEKSGDERKPLLTQRSTSQPPNSSSRFFIVEPVVVLYFIAFHSTGPLMQQLVYARIGAAMRQQQGQSATNATNRPPANTSDICTVDFSEQQKQQAQASQVQMIFTLAAVLPALFSTVLLGANSDTVGRRLALAAPLVGEMMRIVTCIIVAVTSVPVLFLALGLFLEGVSGSAAGFMMGAYSYMADTSNPKHRTLRLVAVEFCMGVGNTGSQVVIGYVIASFGWLWPLVGVLFMHVLCLLYVICLLPETVSRSRSTDSPTFMSPKHFLRTAQLYITDTKARRRRVLQLCLLIISLTMIIDVTGTETLTLYLLNWPFCWDSVNIGYYNAAAYAARYIGAIVLVAGLRLCLSESALLLIGLISNAAFDVVLAVAMTSWVIFVAPVAGIAMPLVVSMSRAISSHMVEAHEQGALFGSQAWVSMFSALVGSLLFNVIYSSTLYSLHGLVYIIAASMLVIPISLSVHLVLFMRQQTALRTPLARHRRKATVGSICGPAISPASPPGSPAYDVDEEVFD